ncbi:MAG TPA: E3 binding domain-containing protein, partial [Usitatibacter sp.]
MATKVFMEALSPTMEEGRLVKWLKAEGDAVKGGDVLAEVETDKAVMELVARGEGLLRKRLVAEGATAPVGTLVGVIGTKDEDITALVGSAGAAVPAAAVSAPAATPAPVPTPAAAPVAPASSPSGPSPVAPVATPSLAPAAPAPPAGNGGRTISSPLARRMADERGVDLSRVAGSGPGGRVIKRDIEAAASGAQPVAGRAPTVARTPGVDFEDIALTQIRKTIAKRLAESIGPIPTFYLTAQFDLERAAEMR